MMTMITDRTAEILNAAIGEFIKTGEPVSSSWLYEYYDFGIKPAMIRLELEKLSDEGYLEQPHHSAGRVPSDMGYEFFANRILAAEKSFFDFRPIKNLFARRALAGLAEFLSDELTLLGVASSGGEVCKEGIENLVERPVWETPDAIKRIVRDFAELDERLGKAEKKLKRSAEPQVFIGKKSPVTKSNDLAVVAGDYKIDGEDIFLLAIGPKRMDYRKTLKIFKNLYK